MKRTEMSLSSSRDQHNAFQSEVFTNDVQALKRSITPDVDARLARIANSVPNLGPESRVLDVGAGTGALIPHLQRRGVQDILAVDVCPAMLETLKEDLNARNPPTLGNVPAVRTWEGDVDDIPRYQGPFDCSFFNAVYGNLYSPRDCLLKIALMTRPGGYIVISHPLGRSWHEKFGAQNPQLVPHPLPERDACQQLVSDLPLIVESFEDESNFYFVLLRVPPDLEIPVGPVYMEGNVVTGFGRGSKQLGVPTANIPPDSLGDRLHSLPAGVYFGWVRLLDPSHSSPTDDGEVHRMVMNIGRRPTFNDAHPETTVELHVLHTFAEDFYGKKLRAVATGFIRPEVKFSGIQELLSRIKADIGTAKTHLESDFHKVYASDSFLSM